MNEKFCFLIGLESFVEVEVHADLRAESEHDYWESPNGRGHEEYYNYYVIDDLKIVNLRVVGKEVPEDVILDMAERKMEPMLEGMDPAEDYCQEPDDYYDDCDPAVEARCYFGVDY